MAKLLALFMAVTNVMYITDDGRVMVAEVVKQSGSITYVKPCGSTAIGNVAIRTRDAIPVKLSCREFFELKR